MRRCAFLLQASLLMVIGFAPPVAGQSVRVTVVQRASREPVPGAIASLVGTGGERLTTKLTDERGQVELEGETGRRVRVLVESVGYSTSRSDEFELGSDMRELEVVIESRRFLLPTVAVRDRRRCEAGPNSEASVALWEEVRKALTATTLSAPRAPQLAVWRYVRRLDRSHRILAETTSTRSVVGAAFATASAGQLSARGFTQEQDGAAFYFAPDAELLLAPAFVQTHCFGVRWDEGPKRLVGLTFQPQSGRTTSDIEGTLWLDARSGDLRWLDFAYTRQPNATTDAEPEGRVQFERLPNGAWVVQRWHIRLPVLARVQASRVGRFTIPARDTVIGFREEGGWLTGAVLNVDGSSMSVSGVVFDSLRGLPLANVRIVLGGGVAEARTDQEGRYTLKHFMPGRYLVKAEHPRLAAFGSDPSEREAVLTVGQTTTVRWAVASASAIHNRYCPKGPNENETRRAIIAQVVDTTAGHTIAGARTSISWRAARLQALGGVVISAAQDSAADTSTDENGFATFCVGRQVLQVTLHAEDAGRETVHTVSVPDTTIVAEVQLSLSAAPRRGLHFRARVIARSSPDSLLAAELMIPAQGRSYHTDNNGSIDIGALDAGPLAIVVRSPGYQPMFTRVLLPLVGDSVQTFILEPIPQPLQTVIVTGTRSNDLRDFEDRRAVNAGGTYLSRDDLASRDASRLSDILRTVRGVRIQRRADGTAVLVSPRGAFSRSIRECFYQIILDGHRLYALGSGGPSGLVTPPSIDEFAPAGLQAIEVYTGPATTPAQFGGLGAACGTIVLWTRRK